MVQFSVPIYVILNFNLSVATVVWSSHIYLLAIKITSAVFLLFLKMMLLVYIWDNFSFNYKHCLHVALLFLMFKSLEFIIMSWNQSLNTDILSMTIMQVIVIHSVKIFLFLERTNYDTVLLSFNWKNVSDFQLSIL